MIQKLKTKFQSWANKWSGGQSCSFVDWWSGVDKVIKQVTKRQMENRGISQAPRAGQINAKGENWRAVWDFICLQKSFRENWTTEVGSTPIWTASLVVQECSNGQIEACVWVIYLYGAATFESSLVLKLPTLGPVVHRHSQHQNYTHAAAPRMVQGNRKGKPILFVCRIYAVPRKTNKCVTLF